MVRKLLDTLARLCNLLCMFTNTFQTLVIASLFPLSCVGCDPGAVTVEHPTRPVKPTSPPVECVTNTFRVEVKPTSGFTGWDLNGFSANWENKATSKASIVSPGVAVYTFPIGAGSSNAVRTVHSTVEGKALLLEDDPRTFCPKGFDNTETGGHCIKRSIGFAVQSVKVPTWQSIPSYEKTASPFLIDVGDELIEATDYYLNVIWQANGVVTILPEFVANVAVTECPK